LAARSFEKNRSVGRPATPSAVSTAEAPGIAVTASAGVLRGAHQPIARIGNQRRAGIGHHRDRAAAADARQDFRRAAGAYGHDRA